MRNYNKLVNDIQLTPEEQLYVDRKERIYYLRSQMSYGFTKIMVTIMREYPTLEPISTQRVQQLFKNVSKEKANEK